MTMANTTLVLDVGGMSCQHCVKAVTGGVSAVAGVKGVQVSLEKNQVTVDFDPGLATPVAIRTAIEDQGYTVK
jgi:copper chaperone